MRPSPSRAGLGREEGAAQEGRQEGRALGAVGRTWAGPYQGGRDPRVEAQQAHVMLHATVHHQPAPPSRPPHQLPVDCEDRGAVWGLPARSRAGCSGPRTPRAALACAEPRAFSRPPRTPAASAPPTRPAGPGLTHAPARAGSAGGAGNPVTPRAA